MEIVSPFHVKAATCFEFVNGEEEVLSVPGPFCEMLWCYLEYQMRDRLQKTSYTSWGLVCSPATGSCSRVSVLYNQNVNML